jgi:ketosteroid isomerase-like protein
MLKCHHHSARRWRSEEDARVHVKPERYYPSGLESAMSEERNAEVVQQVYAAFVRKDLPAVLQLQTDDAVWSVAGPADRIPWAAACHGHAGVTDFIKTLGQWLVPEQFDIHEYMARGDKVVALGYQRGHVGPSKVPYEFDFVHVWTLRDGLVAGFRVYYDSAYVASVLEKRPAGSH